MITINKDKILSEIGYRTCRSSGPGGQAVNKISTKAELFFNISNSNSLSHHQKVMIINKLKNRINNEGFLILACDTTRSQLKNKELVAERFFKLITAAIKTVKKRKATKPTKSSIEKRLNKKTINSFKKSMRKKPVA